MATIPSSRRGRRFLLVSFGVIFALSLVIGIGTARIRTAERDCSRWRDDFARSVDIPSRCTVQVNLGPAVLAPARLLLGLLGDIPPEARLALSAARRASIGVYTVDRAGETYGSATIVDFAGQELEADGWIRVVAVRDGDESVTVYLPPDASPDRDTIDLCVAVCDGDQLILVSARLQTEPLLALASQHLPEDFLGLRRSHRG